MQVLIDFQGKLSSLERPDNHYGDNLTDLQDILTTALYGVGVQLNGEVSLLPEESNENNGSMAK